MSRDREGPTGAVFRAAGDKLTYSDMVVVCMLMSIVFVGWRKFISHRFYSALLFLK